MCITGHSTLSEVIMPKLDDVEKDLYHIYNSKGANTAGKIRDDNEYRNSMRERMTYSTMVRKILAPRNNKAKNIPPFSYISYY